MNADPSKMKFCGEQVTERIVCHTPGRLYSISGNQDIMFTHMDDDILRIGTTNEELLTVLIHRTRQLDKEVPCVENKIALAKMEEALAAFQGRSNRVASHPSQGQSG